jgi:predicted adenine nucleotide alpha hydrolase (AANH) superfamily ATPase
MEQPKKILAHICCAVDAIYFLKKLREDFPDSEIVGYFYDPNIHPYEEYLLRLKESERACRMLGIKFLEGEYNLENWLSKVKGYEKEPEKGARCVLCFDERLENSVKKAKELGCDAFTTTLLMSPKKSQEQLKKVGEKLAKLYGIEYIHKDYRKGGGVQEMNKLVREKEIWRQDYCGCMFALFQQKKEDSFYDLVSFFGRLPGTKEEHIFLRQIRVIAELLGLSTTEEEFQFLGWFPLRGKIEISKLKLVIPSLIKPFSAPIRGIAKGDIVKVIGNRLYLNRQNVTIELVPNLGDYRPGSKNSIPLANPTFIVEEKYRKLLLENRIAATLEVKFKPSKSRNLIVGNLQSAKRVLTFPVDCLIKEKCPKLENAENLLKQLREELVEGKTVVVFLGAQLYGAGLKFLIEQHPEIEEKLEISTL